MGTQRTSMMASQESQAMLTLPLFGVEMERFISSKILNIGSLIQRANLMLELISIPRIFHCGASQTTSMELYNGTIGEPTSSSLATIGDTTTGTFQWTRVIPPSHGPLLSGGLAVLRRITSARDSARLQTMWSVL